METSRELWIALSAFDLQAPESVSAGSSSPNTAANASLIESADAVERGDRVGRAERDHPRADPRHVSLVVDLDLFPEELSARTSLPRPLKVRQYLHVPLECVERLHVTPQPAVRRSGSRARCRAGRARRPTSLRNRRSPPRPSQARSRAQVSRDHGHPPRPPHKDYRDALGAQLSV